MDIILRQCYRGIAYMYYNPEDKIMGEKLKKLLLTAWAMGYTRTFFDNPSNLTNEITVEDMTEWEIRYIFRE